jgi:hypothetical protein
VLRRLRDRRVETSAEGLQTTPAAGGHGVPDAVSPGRGLYALAGGLAPIRIFDLLRGGSRQLSGSTPEGRWVLVRFSPGGDRIVTVQQRTVTFERGGDWVQESVLTLWDVATGEQRACSRSTADLRRGERTDDPNDLAVGGDHVVWCGRDGVVALHDAHTLEPLSRIRVSGALDKVEFSPDEDAVDRAHATCPPVETSHDVSTDSAIQSPSRS